jgi:hypothetical protein
MTEFCHRRKEAPIFRRQNNMQEFENVDLPRNRPLACINKQCALGLKYAIFKKLALHPE